MMTMKSMLTHVYVALLSLAYSGSADQGPSSFNTNLDPNALDKYSNNSLFLQWRPRYHFLAPAGHMNDPCGPMYDETRDTYHLFYQSFPNHVQGGNGSWGHAVSKDLISWTEPIGWRDTVPLVLQPGPYPQYDWIGDWSGSAQPVNLHGEADGNLTAFLTCVKGLPVGWTEDEKRGSEQQCLATSSDGGRTWQKYHGNPVLSEPPAGWNFTGWRDPFFQPMPDIDVLLGYEKPHYYMVLGSGIHNAGPRIPLYTAEASDLSTWTYLGALFDIGGNSSWGSNPFRTGSVGYNFELAGFNTMVEKKEFGGDGKTLHHVINMGTEGGNNSYHQNVHWTMYGLGSIARRSNGSVALDLAVVAPLDWGNLYASTTFYDSKNNRRILWGWSDEDMNGYGIKAQGFQGSLGLPREIFVLKVHNVSAPVDGRLSEQPGIWESSSECEYTVTMLGSRPLPELVEALHKHRSHWTKAVSWGGKQHRSFGGVHGKHFHLKASLQITDSCEPAGFLIRASPDMKEVTRIEYNPSNFTLTMDRASSSLVSNFTKSNYQSFFQPFTINSIPEVLIFDIFVDGSLVEIFLNNRLALTSRIYPTRADSLGVSAFSVDGKAIFENVEIWDIAKNVFPNRPLNSSSALHWDPYYETHMTFNNVDGIPLGFQIYDGY